MERILITLIYLYLIATEAYAITKFCPPDSSHPCLRDNSLFVNENVKACKIKTSENEESLLKQITFIQNQILESKLLKNREPHIRLTPSSPLPIYLLDYQTSSHPQATFCKRDPNLVSTVVIHHTFTEENKSPIDINNEHINNPASENPWYMIGYNYLISHHFQEATGSRPKVFQGRPQEIQGAHAGGQRMKPTQEELKFFQGKSVTCGNQEQGFEDLNILDVIQEKGGVNPNMTSYGIAIIGNYQPPYFESQGLPHFAPPTVDHPRESTLRTAAKLICDLQKQNPRVTKLVPHSYYKNTQCPGILKLYLKRIGRYAQQEGCQFEVKFKREDQRWQ
ncbi:MAG: peptidoglycan recognition family protein [Bacteriovoracaceae bacterium]|jgi:hypothetical protein|nr:peptidoglycan recognition family protein [Bacteriovoracaceae bacterium]